MPEEPYTATDTVDAYADGYNDGQSAIWSAIVCSTCGRNHDSDESIPCDESHPVPFRDWVDSVNSQRLTREGGMALIAEASRFDKAYMRERKRLFDLRRGIRLALSHLPEHPDRAVVSLERAYAADEEIEHEIQAAAGLPKIENVEEYVMEDSGT